MIVSVLIAGCTPEPPSSSTTPSAAQETNAFTPISFSHYAESITLKISEPPAQIGNYTVKLLSIAEDGTTQIQVLQSQRTLAARPGERFVGGEFGSKGLTLESASKSTGTATLTRRYSVSN
jgi:hypothetical protein